MACYSAHIVLVQYLSDQQFTNTFIVFLQDSNSDFRLLYSGIENRLVVKSLYRPLISEPSSPVTPKITATTAARHKDAADELADNTAYVFMMTAELGQWYRGEFHTSRLESGECLVRTKKAVPDKPAKPFVMQYRGAITVRTIEVRYEAPERYGGGYTDTDYLLRKDCSWLNSALKGDDKEKLLEKIPPEALLSLSQWKRHRFDAAHSQGVSVIWEREQERVDFSTKYFSIKYHFVLLKIEMHFWRNTMRDLQSKVEPTVNVQIPATTFVVYVKPVKPEEDKSVNNSDSDDSNDDDGSSGDHVDEGSIWDDYVEVYRGKKTVCKIGGPLCPKQLKPGTKYRIRVAAENIVS